MEGGGLERWGEVKRERLNTFLPLKGRELFDSLSGRGI
jgi:hypothetical protein